jgi:ABC-2 type transport system permease protein
MSGQWHELLKRRELTKNLVTRQLKLRYKSSSLGFLWSLLNPFLMALVYWAVFSKLLGGSRGMGVDNYKAYLISGLFAWAFFAGSIGDSANAFVGNISLVKKVYFPRIVLPVSAVLTNLVNFVLSLVVVFILLIIWEVPSGWEKPSGICLLMLPLLILIELMLACGLSFFISSLNVLFRDVEHMLQVILLAGFFLTPVIYPYARVVPEHLRLVYFLNPMAGIIVSYQKILYEGTFPSPQFLYIPLVISIAVLISGYRFLVKAEGMIVDQL